jgi:integrase
MRAQKPKGSVVFNNSRATWNYLWVENGRRKSRKLGTIAELPTKADALRKAESLRRDVGLVARRSVPTVREVVEQYRAEKMPVRYSTRRPYEVWLRLYILPKWGKCLITELQPRPVELWLNSLDLAPRSKASIRGLINLLWDYVMWSGVVPVDRNPMSLVTVKGASKRVRKPRSLRVEEFQRFIAHLEEPFRTIALISVCFGLRISECLGLKWLDVDWLAMTLSIQRSIVRQRVDDVKTIYSERSMTIDDEMLEIMKRWRQTTEFSDPDDWMFASPVQFGDLPWSADAVNDAYKKAGLAAGVGHVSTHTMRHTYRSWLDAAGTPIAVQQKLMRHADIRTTMNIYGDVVTDEMAQAHSKVVRMAIPHEN